MRGLSTRRQLLLAGMLAPTAGQAQPAPLLLGVVPHVSARVLAANYQSLRNYLEGRLERPIQVVTATDIASFHARACEGQYECFITTPNLGALALSDDKARVIGVFEPGVPALAVATKKQAPTALTALRGRKLALPNPASLVALRGLAWLKERGLEDGVDFEAVRVPNEDSLGRWLSSGDAPLALMSRGEFNLLSEPHRQTLDVVQQYALLPGFFAMLPVRPGAVDAVRLRQSLLDFFASTAADAFRSLTGHSAMRAYTRADAAELEPFIEPTRRALAAVR